jgi:hypothetical protein
MKKLSVFILIFGLFFSSCEWGFKDPPQYTVVVLSPLNGSVYISREKAPEGYAITVTVNPASGYVLDKLTYNTAELTGNNPYVFEMPASDVTVKAEFTSVPSGKFTVTIDETIGHGRIYAAPTNGSPGAHITVTVVPYPLYRLKPGSLQYGEVSITDPEKDDSERLRTSLTLPASNVTVTGDFELIPPPVE